jgi:hypothetical protein
MGWKLVIQEITKYRLIKINPAVAMHNTPLSTNLSAADIVNHCYDINLVTHPSQPHVNAAAVAGASMAFAAHPSIPKIPIVVREGQTTGTSTDEHGFANGVGISLRHENYLLTRDRSPFRQKSTERQMTATRP